MATERESLPGLTLSRTFLESKLSVAQNVFEHIATPGFSQKGLLRLDTAETDFDSYIDNLDRVTGIQERLRDVVLPRFQTRLSIVNQTIDSLTRDQFERLSVLRERYTRIQERIGAGLPVQSDLLIPITTEIQRLEVATAGTFYFPSSERPRLEEGERLPVIKVNVTRREIEVDGRKIRVHGFVVWNGLKYMLDHSSQDISPQELQQEILKINAYSRYGPGQLIGYLRKKIELDPRNSQIIVSTFMQRNISYRINAEVRFVEETPAPLVEAAPVEPGVSVELQAPAEEVSEREKQIEAIRQNLGNPDAFDFPAGMTVNELFDQDTEEGKAFNALNNVLHRASIRSVEELLGKSAEELVGKHNEKDPGVRGFGITNLEKTLDQLLKKGILPKEEVSAAPAIAEIQRLANEGRLTAPELLAKAQEAAGQFGGTIEFQAPVQPRSGMAVHEESRIALDAILDSSINPVTSEEILDLMGKMKDGRDFRWPNAKNSMVRVVGVINAIKDKTEADNEFLNKVKAYFGMQDETDIKVVMSALNVKLTEWFKKKLNGSEDGQVSVQAEAGAAAESELSLPSSPRLTERQAARQTLITGQVRLILTDMKSFPQLPERMGGSIVTQLAKSLGNNVTDSVMEKAAERDYIRPTQAEGHHFEYDQKDFLILTFLVRHGNNRNRTQRRELMRIINREFSAWQVQRSNQ